MPIVKKKTKHPYIAIDSKISGGQPVIRNTRIKVQDIAIRYELMGMSADSIIDEYPHLRLEQVHDALSYYYEHKDMFDSKFREDQSFNSTKKTVPIQAKRKIEYGIIFSHPKNVLEIS